MNYLAKYNIQKNHTKTRRTQSHSKADRAKLSFAEELIDRIDALEGHNCKAWGFNPRV